MKRIYCGRYSSASKAREPKASLAKLAKDAKRVFETEGVRGKSETRRQGEFKFLDSASSLTLDP
jgi:hypothetical protein